MKILLTLQKLFKEEFERVGVIARLKLPGLTEKRLSDYLKENDIANSV